MKTCNKCEADKELSEFSLKKNKSGSISVRSTCRECMLDKQKERRKLEAESARDSRLMKQKEWASKNKEKVRELKAKYRIKAKIIKLSSVLHEGHVVDYIKFIDNISSIMFDQHVREWSSNRTVKARWMQNHDMCYVVFNRLKRGVQRCFAGMGVDTEGWFKSLPYTTEQLKMHIENQFTHGMSWDNRHEWHIDHIRPLCSFDIKSIHDHEFKECFALSNLRPIWAHHNRIKYHCFDKYMIKNNQRVPLRDGARG